MLLLTRGTEGNVNASFFFFFLFFWFCSGVKPNYYTEALYILTWPIVVLSKWDTSRPSDMEQHSLFYLLISPKTLKHSVLSRCSLIGYKKRNEHLLFPAFALWSETKKQLPLGCNATLRFHFIHIRHGHSFLPVIHHSQVPSSKIFIPCEYLCFGIFSQDILVYT